MNDLRIAFLPIARVTFDIPFATEKAQQARATLLKAGLDVIGPEDLITDISGVGDASQELKSEDLDLLVLFQASFADSSMATALANEIDAPIFMWAVKEPHTGERLRLNSLCGINLAGHAFTRQGISYGYAYSTADDPNVLEQILVHARAGKARRKLRQARLGRIGENPDGFETCLFRPDQLQDRFGLEVVQLDLVDDVFDQVRKLPSDQTKALKAKLEAKIKNLDEMDQDAVGGSLGTYQVLKKISEEQKIQGLAVRCWPEFFTELGCAACGAMSMLTDDMIPCSCEADVNGTVTQLILQTISGSQAFGTDLVSVDDERDALVVWHCGLAPLGMADPEFEARATIHSNRQLPLLMEFPLKPGKVTIARLSEAQGDFTLAIGEGEMIRGPLSFSGTSGLLKFNQPAAKILDRILANGLEHHISITYGDFKDELCVLANMLDLEVLDIA